MMPRAGIIPGYSDIDKALGWFLDRGVSLVLYTCGKDNLSSLSSEDFAEALRFASVYCSISVQHKGAIPSYPSADQIMI